MIFSFFFSFILVELLCIIQINISLCIIVYWYLNYTCIRQCTYYFSWISVSFHVQIWNTCNKFACKYDFYFLQSSIIYSSRYGNETIRIKQIEMQNKDQDYFRQLIKWTILCVLRLRLRFKFSKILFITNVYIQKEAILFLAAKNFLFRFHRVSGFFVFNSILFTNEVHSV